MDSASHKSSPFDLLLDIPGSSLVKHGVLVKLGSMCGATITNKSQERTRDVYDYYHRCLQLEHDQTVRNNTELLLDAYNTEANAAVGAWVLLESIQERGKPRGAAG